MLGKYPISLSPSTFLYTSYLYSLFKPRRRKKK